MKILLIIAILSCSSLALGAETDTENPAPASGGEKKRSLFDRSNLFCPDFVRMPGVVYFKEKQLSFNNASTALEDLQSLVDDTQTTLDLKSLENDLIVLRGTIYRLTLQAQKEQNGKADPALLKRFCEFLQGEAVLRR